jgi:hypothetical protein
MAKHRNAQTAAAIREPRRATLSGVFTTTSSSCLMAR